MAIVRPALAVLAILLLSFPYDPATAADTRCANDEVVGVKMLPPMGPMGTDITTRDRRVLRFDLPAELSVAMGWQLTTLIRICRTDIAGIYSVFEPQQPASRAHGKIIRGPKP